MASNGHSAMSTGPMTTRGGKGESWLEFLAYYVLKDGISKSVNGVPELKKKILRYVEWAEWATKFFVQMVSGLQKSFP